MSGKNCITKDFLASQNGSKKKKKQKMNTGGMKYENLSQSQKTFYDSLNSEQQKNYLASLSKPGAVETQGAETAFANQNLTDTPVNNSEAAMATQNALSGISSATGGTTSDITGIIGAAIGLADQAAGEQNQYGEYDSNVQTYLGESTDPIGNLLGGFEMMAEAEEEFGDSLTIE